MIRAFRDRAPNCFNFTKHKTIQQQKSLVFIQTLISYQFQFKPVKTLHLTIFKDQFVQCTTFFL